MLDHSNKFKHEIKRVADAFIGVERERDRFRADLAAEKKVNKWDLMCENSSSVRTQTFWKRDNKILTDTLNRIA